MVIQTKSVEYMPLFLSLASFFNGVCWTAYALIRFDPYITVSRSGTRTAVIPTPLLDVMHLVWFRDHVNGHVKAVSYRVF